MPETDTIRVSASIASTGPGLRYIGRYVYAYSGAVSVDNNLTSLIEEVSGSGLIIAKVQFSYITHAVQDYEYQIYLNDLLVWSQNIATAGISDGTAFNIAFIMVPPFTKLKITAIGKSDGTGRDMAASLTGRVYGTE